MRIVCILTRTIFHLSLRREILEFLKFDFVVQSGDAMKSYLERNPTLQKHFSK